jgi:hypothetical protein
MKREELVRYVFSLELCLRSKPVATDNQTAAEIYNYEVKLRERSQRLAELTAEIVIALARDRLLDPAEWVSK